MKSNFADNLKKIRKENNLSQEQLADKLGVSRQSVSKWESSAAYPEMDKVLQLCKMFNLNIDELLNQNISEVHEEQESKNKINNYVNNFLEYITKTVKLFISLSFKDKVKCLVEQSVVILSLLLICIILGGIMSSVVGSIFAFAHGNFYYIIYGILKGIYIFMCLIFSIIIIAHIFKIRYLDYYKIVENNTENNSQEDTLSSNKQELVNDKKIIIRNPEHSEYNFLNAMVKLMLLFIKFFTLFIFAVIAFIFIFEVFGLVLSLYHISTHSLFIGVSLAALSVIAITIIILILLYSFIFNKKSSIKILFIVFIVSLALCGIGVGQVFICTLNMKYNNKLFENTKKLEKTFVYKEGMNINSWHDYYEFDVDNNLDDKVKVTIKYNDKAYKVNMVEDEKSNSIDLSFTTNFNDFSYTYNLIITDLKNNTLSSIESSSPEVVITASEENVKNMINKKSTNRMTNLEQQGNKFFLDEVDENEQTLCYQENGFYNNCVSIELDEGNISDFKYDKDGLHYDGKKYECSNNENKYFYCDYKDYDD